MIHRTQNVFFILLFSMMSLIIQAQEDLFTLIRNKTEVEKIEVYLDKFPSKLNEPSKEGFTPLILAAYNGNLDYLTLFLKNGADVNYISTMGTALMAATVKGNFEIAQILLKSNAAIDLTDDKGTTALMYAVQFKNKQLIELLMKYNPNKNLVDSNGKTAFEYAVFSGNKEIIDLLK